MVRRLTLSRPSSGRSSSTIRSRTVENVRTSAGAVFGLEEAAFDGAVRQVEFLTEPLGTMGRHRLDQVFEHCPHAARDLNAVLAIVSNLGNGQADEIIPVRRAIHQTKFLKKLRTRYRCSQVIEFVLRSEEDPDCTVDYFFERDHGQRQREERQAGQNHQLHDGSPAERQ